MFRRSAILLTLCLATVTAQAALLGRAPVTANGTDYQAYYDDVQGITWLADANYAQTSGYDADGLMAWSAALGWIASLNSANHLGTNDWRLPTVTDKDALGCNGGPTFFSGGDCGYNVDLATGEMAHMFFSTLGNTTAYDVSAVEQPCWTVGANCLAITVPFSNLLPSYYWYGTEYPLDTSSAWIFAFDQGLQELGTKNNDFYAWAVTDGDAFAAVPVPGAVWLFGSALGVMGWMRRKATV